MARPRSSMLSRHLLHRTQSAPESSDQELSESSPSPPNTANSSGKDIFKPQIPDPARPCDVKIHSRAPPGTLPENRKKGIAYTFIVPKEPEQKFDAAGNPISKAEAAKLKRQRERVEVSDEESDDDGVRKGRKSKAGGGAGLKKRKQDSDSEAKREANQTVAGSQKRKQLAKTSTRGEPEPASKMTEAEEDAALDEEEREKLAKGGVKSKARGAEAGSEEKSVLSKETEKAKGMKVRPQKSSQGGGGRDNRYGGAGREGRFKLT